MKEENDLFIYTIKRILEELSVTQSASSLQKRMSEYFLDK